MWARFQSQLFNTRRAGKAFTAQLAIAAELGMPVYALP
jgi:hypothetical protein